MHYDGAMTRDANSHIDTHLREVVPVCLQCVTLVHSCRQRSLALLQLLLCLSEAPDTLTGGDCRRERLAYGLLAVLRCLRAPLQGRNGALLHPLNPRLKRRLRLL